MFGGDPVAFLIGSIYLIPALFVAIPVHELGHALAAVAMGDPSPRNRGYLRPRLRPLLNVYGVVAAFLANVTWGNRVPINEYRLNGAGRKIVYALGGPAANLLAAIVFGVVVRVLALTQGAVPDPLTFNQPPLGWVSTICYAVFFLNLATFAFQLLPFPGLDGWRVVEALFRNRNPRFFFNVAANTQTIWVITLVVVVLSPYVLRFSILDAAVAIFFQPASNGILGQCAGYVALHPCLLSGRF
jgi:Zn-dependent protease